MPFWKEHNSECHTMHQKIDILAATLGFPFHPVDQWALEYVQPQARDNRSDPVEAGVPVGFLNTAVPLQAITGSSPSMAPPWEYSPPGRIWSSLMSEFFQDLVYASSPLGIRCIRSSGKCIAHGDLWVYRHYSNFFLIGEGQICNFVNNYDKSECKGGEWKTWKNFVYFLQKRPSLNPDRV